MGRAVPAGLLAAGALAGLAAMAQVEFALLDRP